eukprot:TRINITY_DN52577_c0_g1_i1.p2 TRINITY_DN52577_c0_g1~~TRINITY_DN52577_c0_g1_i1.p2  ORF type:complete len:150 (-),score=25.18 TRINITY_DN52577_c0_g1_i1:143-592(-)
MIRAALKSMKIPFLASKKRNQSVGCREQKESVAFTQVKVSEDAFRATHSTSTAGSAGRWPEMELRADYNSAATALPGMCPTTSDAAGTRASAEAADIPPLFASSVSLHVFETPAGSAQSLAPSPTPSLSCFRSARCPSSAKKQPARYFF